jgi:phosphatidylserine decarboxylase
MSKPMPLPVFDRRSSKLFDEFMDDSSSTYEARPHRSAIQWITSSPTVDWLIAAYQNTRFSARKIDPFIRKHKIDMSEFEPGPFDSYAAFFERRFLPGKRPFPDRANEMGAFAEGRYFGWEKLTPEQRFPVKGASLEAETLLGSADRAKPFEGGPVILARLSPVDYIIFTTSTMARQSRSIASARDCGPSTRTRCKISPTSCSKTSAVFKSSRPPISAL